MSENKYRDTGGRALADYPRPRSLSTWQRSICFEGRLMDGRPEGSNWLRATSACRVRLTQVRG
jgi:hypothetical protein